MPRKADQTTTLVTVAAGAVVVPVRGMRRLQAASYCAVSENQFQAWVNAGIMPQPIKPGPGLSIWDIRAVDEAFDRLLKEEEEQAPGKANSWD